MSNIAIQSLASRFADLMAGDAVMMADLDLTIEAGEEVKLGPLKLYEHFARVFGDQMQEFPLPGSKGGNNPDRYKLKATDKTEKGSFYSDLYSDLPQGKVQKAALKGIGKALTGAADTPAAYATMSTPDLKAEKRKFEQRVNAGSRAVRMAVSCWFQAEMIKEFPTVICKIKPAITASTYPVAIFKASDATEFKVMSLGAFLQLDLDGAEDKGGSYTDVIETVRRSGNGGGENATSIRTLDQFSEYGADVLNYLEKLASDSKMVGALYKKVQADEGLLNTIFGLAAELDKITSKPDLARKYAMLQVAASADGKKEAA